MMSWLAKACVGQEIVGGPTLGQGAVAAAWLAGAGQRRLAGVAKRGEVDELSGRLDHEQAPAAKGFNAEGLEHAKTLGHEHVDRGGVEVDLIRAGHIGEGRAHGQGREGQIVKTLVQGELGVALPGQHLRAQKVHHAAAELERRAGNQIPLRRNTPAVVSVLSGRAAFGDWGETAATPFQ
jgi:hypothetical protein